MKEISCPAPDRKNRATQLEPQHLSPLLYQDPAMHLLPSSVLQPNSGLTQYECGHMKPLVCAKQSSTSI
jgi:hypothetical protein